MSSQPPELRAPAGRGDAPRGPRLPAPTRPRIRIGWWVAWIVGLLVINYWLGSRATQSASRVRVPYSPFFLDQVKDGHVASITSKGTTVQGTFTVAERYGTSKPTTRFKTEIPTFADTNALSQLLRQKKVSVNAVPLDTGAPWWESLLVGFGPTILLVGLLVWFSRRAGGMQSVLGQFGRSRARLYEPSGDHVTFADVAGIDEAKQELSEVVDFLRDAEKYRRLGARVPHGVLLSGPPGTGKTLLARAVAGEAKAPFFSMAASEFVEAIVGVGASRVRDLFTKAKEAAPAIIFIDELDAIGRSRTSGVAGFSGGNDEREQTLNQILTEMDGFDSSTGVIVIAATNRPDVLDQALLRPGRFDRRVAVQPPDRGGREAILRVHTRSVPLGGDVDLRTIAATTPGMVGADLANLVNEAALLAARREHAKVQEADFTDALERIVLGAERKVMMSPADKRRTAYHEGGHADRRDAHSGSRPGTQDLDHPARAGARRHVRRSGRRPVQLLGAGAAREDQGRARRTRGRGGRLRRPDDRRRVGHPAADADRPPDGRALGDERGDRDDRGAPRRRPGPAAAGSVRGLGRDPAADRRRSAAARRRLARRGARAARASTATSSTRSPRRCSSTRRSTRSTPTRPPGSPPLPPSPSGSPATDPQRLRARAGRRRLGRLGLRLPPFFICSTLRRRASIKSGGASSAGVGAACTSRPCSFALTTLRNAVV